MRKRLLFISTCAIVTAFAMGWLAALIANQYVEYKGIAQAMPIIRFERIDEVRKVLIIGLFNPGTLPIEISRTALSYKMNNEIVSADYIIKAYGNKPLVLDPGDTILVPLAKNASIKAKKEMGHYWGQLDFRVPGQVDFYSIHHRFGVPGNATTAG